MATKPIERLMFAQGDKCFFCRKPLARADPSVEHLVAVMNGGKDYDENSVELVVRTTAAFGHNQSRSSAAIG